MNSKNFTFEVQEKIVADTFFCKVNCVEEEQLNFKYAYYLLMNNKRIKTKWYSISNNVEFNLDDNGFYQLACFIKFNGRIDIKFSKVLKYIREEGSTEFISNKDINYNYKLSIFGSCVSRDLLEYDKSKMFDLKTYIARQSIISALSNALTCNIEDIRLESKFQRRQVYGDLIKNSFDLLSKDGSEFLIIDLIDERFPLIKYNSTILTYSNELVLSGFADNNEKLKRKAINKYSLFKRSRKSYTVDSVEINIYLDKFCNRILKIYKCENIIIHKVMMSNYYKNLSGEIKLFPKNHLINNRKINDLLNYMYDYIINKLPNAIVINMYDNFSADESHKWKLAPMHYQEEYYKNVINKIAYKLFERNDN